MYNFQNLGKPTFGDLTDMNAEVQFWVFSVVMLFQVGEWRVLFFTEVHKWMIKDCIWWAVVRIPSNQLSTGKTLSLEHSSGDILGPLCAMCGLLTWSRSLTGLASLGGRLLHQQQKGRLQEDDSNSDVSDLSHVFFEVWTFRAATQCCEVLCVFSCSASFVLCSFLGRLLDPVGSWPHRWTGMLAVLGAAI